MAARAGKDLVSALASGLLTIGPRFGGALDEAAEMFMTAVDAGQGEPLNPLRSHLLSRHIHHRPCPCPSPVLALFSLLCWP